MKKNLKSYTKDQLITRYNMKEIYSNSELKKIPKIELMEEIYGGGLKDDDEFYAGGLAIKKNYVNEVKVIDNRKKKK